MADNENVVKIEPAKAETAGGDRFQKPAKNFMRKRSFDDKREAPEFEERVIEVSRVARTVKGGRRIRFRALVVIGNRKGKIAMGLGKSTDVSEAVKKAVSQAKKHLVTVPIISGTIPYEVTSKHGSAVVMLKPAASGTSIVAGGAVRAIADLAGITDLLSKMLGSANKINNIIATIKALSSFNPAYTERIQKMTDSHAVSSKKAEDIVVIKEEEKKEPARSASSTANAGGEPKADKKPKASAKKVAKKSIK